MWNACFAAHRPPKGTDDEREWLIHMLSTYPFPLAVIGAMSASRLLFPRGFDLQPRQRPERPQQDTYQIKRQRKTCLQFGKRPLKTSRLTDPRQTPTLTPPTIPLRQKTSRTTHKFAAPDTLTKHTREKTPRNSSEPFLSVPSVILHGNQPPPFFSFGVVGAFVGGRGTRRGLL